jgi:hypothetical protein
VIRLVLEQKKRVRVGTLERATGEGVLPSSKERDSWSSVQGEMMKGERQLGSHEERLKGKVWNCFLPLILCFNALQILTG